MGLQKTVPTWDKLFLSHESLCLKTSWDNFSELFCYFDHLLLMHHHQFSCTFHWSCLYLDHPLVIFKLQLSLSLSLSLSLTLSLLIASLSRAIQQLSLFTKSSFLTVAFMAAPNSRILSPHYVWLFVLSDNS